MEKNLLLAKRLSIARCSFKKVFFGQWKSLVYLFQEGGKTPKVMLSPKRNDRNLGHFFFFFVDRAGEAAQLTNKKKRFFATYFNP